MIERGAQLGAVGAFGLMLLGSAGNWFITPMSHPDAGPVRTGLVVLQALVGLAMAGWAYRRIRIESRDEAGVDSAGTQRAAS